MKFWQWLDSNCGPLVSEAAALPLSWATIRYNIIYLIFKRPNIWYNMDIVCSVTRLGNLLDFGQLFEAFGNNQFAQISHILRQFL